MQELGLHSVVERVAEAIREENLELAGGLLWPALDQKPDVGPLWFYAGIISSLTGKQALAFECFCKSQALEPHPANWANMGGMLRSMGRIDECRQVLQRGLNRSPNDPDVLANLAGSYVNEGEPSKGIEYGERALQIRPNHGATMFNMALLYLEAGDYAKGFDLYAEGAHSHRLVKTYDPDPPNLTPELHAKLKGKGHKLIVYGEQGIGDEIMFSTVLRDARRDYEIVFDCHPRLETMFQYASWMKADGYPITLYPTRKSKERDWSVDAAAKMPIGNLGRLYRRDLSSFTWNGPVLGPEPKEARELRQHLEHIAAGRKIIGLALRGGTMSTARTYRMLHPKDLHPLLSNDRYLFVSLDYEDMNPLRQYMDENYGPNRFLWYPSICWAWDYKHVAGLIRATDAVVTVCQSVAHLAAAMGHQTYVLTPSRPAWRYGLTGESWYWYGPNTRLLRQHGSDWAPPCSKLTEALQARLFKQEAA